MKKVIKFSSLLIALLLVTVVQFQVTSESEAAVTVAENEVEWSASNGDSIASIQPDATGIFFIRDDALETTKCGTATFVTTTGTTFNIASGAVTGATGVTRTLVAADYNSSTPASTPLSGAPAVKVGGSNQNLASWDVDAGTFTLLSAATTSTVATFNYHVVDSWDGQDSTARRAKVTSTSDPAGEYATISEVASVGSSTADSTSRVFRGTVSLSDTASTQGTNNDGVWVQDGDTVTVTYLDSAGVVLDTDTVVADGVDPTVSGLVPADGTITNLDNPTIQFDVTDTNSGIDTTPGDAITLAVVANGVTTTISNMSFQAIANGFRVLYAGADWTGTAGVNGGFGVQDSVIFNLHITVTDKAGNVATVTGTSAEITIDETVPTLGSAATGSANTAVTVTFSEVLDAATVDADGSDFTVGGVAATAALVDVDNGAEVDLTVAALASDAKPEVKIVGTIADKAGNAVVVDSVATATDGVKAVITVALDKSLAILADVVKTTVTSDEKLAVSGIKMTVAGPSGATSNAALTAASPTPLSNEGSVTVVAGDTTGIYGVSVQVTDLGGSTTNNFTTVTDEAATFSADGLTVTLANGPIADLNFDGAVTTTDITAITDDGTSISANMKSVDAGARTITLGTAIASGSVVLVTYDYVTDVFEVDVAAPTVTFDPVSGSSIQNTSPFLRLVFDEDEYPGDTYTTVTLTKAELTAPGATTADDILAGFITADNKEFLYAATGLALGAYSLKISATDSAGNKLEDSISAFTVAKRTQTISLRPGWNLVSLAGAPADSAVNSVITSDKVSTVLTYDPTDAVGWLVATRGDDGLTGTLTTIDGSTSLWMFSSAFVSLVIDVPGLSAGTAGFSPHYDLVAGWNMLPVVSQDLTATPDADDYLSGLSWTRAFSYDNATNAFTSIMPLGSDTLSVGSGYLVFLTVKGQLVPP